MPKQWIDYGRGSSTAAQDEGQVSEDLVASAFQFFTRLAAVFAEDGMRSA